MKKLVSRADIFKAVFVPLLIIALIIIIFFHSLAILLLQGLWIATPIVLIITLSPWGNRKLGAVDAKPKLKLLPWIGIIILFELLLSLHFLAIRSFNAPTATPQIIDTVLPWCGIALTALAVGYQCFHRQEKGLLSSSFKPLFNNSDRDVIGLAANQMGSIAIQFALGILLGFTTLSLINLAIMILPLDLAHTSTLLTILVVGTLIQIANTKFYTKTLRKLSVHLAIPLGLVITVIITMVLLMLLQWFANKIGGLLPDFFEKPIHLPAFLKPLDAASAWIIFNALWWIIWTPLAAGFLLALSKGRSLRACLLAIIIPPILILVASSYINFDALPHWLSQILNLIASFILLALFLQKKYLRYTIRRTVPGSETLKFRPPHLLFRSLVQTSILITALFWLGQVYLNAVVLFLIFLPLAVGLAIGWVGLVVGLIKDKN